MYKLLQIPFGATKNDAVVRISDNTYIPFCYSNTDYQEYLKWLSEGNEPLPAEQTA